jgi:hypothetical protein
MDMSGKCLARFLAFALFAGLLVVVPPGSSGADIPDATAFQNNAHNFFRSAAIYDMQITRASGGFTVRFITPHNNLVVMLDAAKADGVEEAEESVAKSANTSAAQAATDLSTGDYSSAWAEETEAAAVTSLALHDAAKCATWNLAIAKLTAKLTNPEKWARAANTLDAKILPQLQQAAAAYYAGYMGYWAQGTNAADQSDNLAGDFGTAADAANEAAFSAEYLSSLEEDCSLPGADLEECANLPVVQVANSQVQSYAGAAASATSAEQSYTVLNLGNTLGDCTGATGVILLGCAVQVEQAALSVMYDDEEISLDVASVYMYSDAVFGTDASLDSTDVSEIQAAVSVTSNAQGDAESEYKFFNGAGAKGDLSLYYSHMVAAVADFNHALLDRTNLPLIP